MMTEKPDKSAKGDVGNSILRCHLPDTTEETNSSTDHGSEEQDVGSTEEEMEQTGDSNDDESIGQSDSSAEEESIQHSQDPFDDREFSDTGLEPPNNVETWLKVMDFVRGSLRLSRAALDSWVVDLPKACSFFSS
jgi:hypothetical protein